MNFKQLIRQNYSFLLKRLDPSHELFGELQQNESIQHRIASIKEQTTPSKQTDALLSTLLDVHDYLQDTLTSDFIEALRSSGQGHIANIFRGMSDEVPMSDEHYRQLRTKTAELCKYMDPDNGLLVRLFSDEVVGCAEVERIRSASGRNEMTRRLIELIMKKADDAFESLIKALNDVGQTHVSYILTGEGNARPLDQKLRDKLISNRVKLIGSIYFKGLVSALVSRDIFTEYDQQHVESRPTENEKIERTLDLIARKSQSAFWGFLIALIETGQEHVAIEVMGCEIIAKVDIEPAGFCTASLEKELRETMQAAFEKDEDRATDLKDSLAKSGTWFAGVEEGSIIVRFRCKNAKALQELHRSGKLDELFTETFRSPLVRNGLNDVQWYIRLRIEDCQFQQCADKFAALKLMTSEHREALAASSKFLVDMMIVNDDLLDKLPVSRECRQAIEAAATRKDQVKMLLDVISRQPDSAFGQLLHALRDTKQEQSALILGSPLTDLRDEETLPQQQAAARGTAENSLRHLIAKLPAKIIDNETKQEISNLCTSIRTVGQNMCSATVRPTPREETNVADSQQIDACEDVVAGEKTEVAENDRVGLILKQSTPVPNSIHRPPSSQQKQPSITENCSCRTEILESSERVYGVTSLRGNMYVLRADSIDVYTTTSDHSFLGRIPLPGLQGHEWNDLTSSEPHTCLYVADCDKRKIRAVELERPVREWEAPGCPCGISVTPDDTLLVTCVFDTSSGFCELVELGLNGGDWLRRVELPWDNQRSLHACKLTTGHYVVSHSCARGLPGQHRVCVVDYKGTILYSYGAQSGSAVGLLDLPCHMSVDDDDFVFVADSGNNRIVLLSPAAQLVRNCIESLSVHHPRRLHLERGTRRLYVGELGDRVVIIHLNDFTPPPSVHLRAVQSRSIQCSA